MTNPSSKPTAAEGLVVDLSHLQRVGPGPHPLVVDVPTSWMAEILTDTDAVIGAPARVALDLTFHGGGGGGGVLVRGTVEVALQVPCARCLEAAMVRSRAEICVDFVPGEASAAVPAAEDDEEGAEVDLEGPEEMTYSGHLLDLRPLVAEQVVMAYPMRALCALGESCRGLCPSCGANLNDLSASRCAACRATLRGEGPASEAESPANSAWKAALKAIREDRGGSS